MRRISARLLAVSLSAAALLATPSCGSGGGGGGPATLTFVPATDLTIMGDGSAPGIGGLGVGDSATNVGKRIGLRFGTFPFIPVAATITSAKLRLRQTSVVGAPYATLGGSVLVDSVDFGFSLDASDFSPSVLTSNIGALSSDTSAVVKELDVTAAVAADHAANSFTSDFLLRFSTVTNANSTDDFAQFEDSENTFGTLLLPQLVVTYQ